MEDSGPAKGKKRPLRRAGGLQSLDELHDMLQAMFPSDDDGRPSVQFTNGAVMGLQQIYATYLQKVASNLAQHDSLNDEQVVAECLGINPGISQIVAQAQGYLAESKGTSASANASKTGDRKMPAASQPAKSTKRRRKKQKITAEMEAEQERLLQQSKATIMGKMQDQQKKQGKTET